MTPSIADPPYFDRFIRASSPRLIHSQDSDRNFFAARTSVALMRDCHPVPLRNASVDRALIYSGWLGTPGNNC